MSPRRQRASASTITEVAKLAGVSIATVSRVLSNHPHVSDEVRQKVLDAVRQLGYEPHRVAQRLRARQSRLIGIIATDITNPFLNTVMACVEEVFFERGFTVLMSNTNADRKKELNYLSMMESEAIDGLVITPTSENVDRVAELSEKGLPITVVDRRMTAGRVDVVLSDNVAGARTATEHLLRLGHQRIGHIGGPLHLTSGRERYEGYLEAMQASPWPASPDLVHFGDYRRESGYNAATELLQSDTPPTALFVANNLMTLGALNAIHDQGISIPDDIAIVGFDDMPWARSLNPPLTTVAQAVEEIGYHAARLLMARIEQPDLPPRTEVVGTQLMVRASCGAKNPLPSP